MDSERALKIEEAEEMFVDVSHPSARVQLWFRTWGIKSGIPVLFVHGGPGNCVDDYQNITVLVLLNSLDHAFVPM